jgi:hypothetical protein
VCSDRSSELFADVSQKASSAHYVRKQNVYKFSGEQVKTNRLLIERIYSRNFFQSYSSAPQRRKAKMREQPAWKRNFLRICANSDRLGKKRLGAKKRNEAQEYAIV